MRHWLALLLLSAITVYGSGGDADPPKSDPEQQAKAFAEQVLKTMLAKDLDAVMKMADVPWYHDKKKVIKDAAELKRELKSLFDQKDCVLPASLPESSWLIC